MRVVARQQSMYMYYVPARGEARQGKARQGSGRFHSVAATTGCTVYLNLNKELQLATATLRRLQAVMPGWA